MYLSKTMNHPKFSIRESVTLEIHKDRLGEISARIDPAQRAILINTYNEVKVTIPLVGSDNSERKQGIYLEEQGDIVNLHIGDVEYHPDRPMTPEEVFPLNETRNHLPCKLVKHDGGTLGMIDLRDIGKPEYVKNFSFHVMAIRFGICKGDLVVDTLKFKDEYNMPRWYEELR